MARRLNVKSDGSEMPILCETCLGDCPFVKIQRDLSGKECKNCTRRFTVFRWRAGRSGRFKKTEICQTCCSLKNVCQVCILDLQYGLPVQVRDTLLGIDSSLPRNEMNMVNFAEESDRGVRAGTGYESSYGKTRPNEAILKLQKSKPYYMRNRPHICSFHARGVCKRGAECPYRHEMPITGELLNQNIKDRIHGVNDPVAIKTLRNLIDMPSLESPEDKAIRTLYVGGLDSSITEMDIKDHFHAHGEIDFVRLVPQKSCAFVAYTTREGAERATKELYNQLVINGLSLKLGWGRSKPEFKVPDEANQQLMAYSGSWQQNQLLQQPGTTGDYLSRQMRYSNIPRYPSMDSQRMGSGIPSQLQNYAYPSTSAREDEFVHPSFLLAEPNGASTTTI